MNKMRWNKLTAFANDTQNFVEQTLRTNDDFKNDQTQGFVTIWQSYYPYTNFENEQIIEVLIIIFSN